MVACKPSPSEPLGPQAAFVVFEPLAEQTSGPVVVQRTRSVDGVAGWVTAALTDGFAAELMRTVFVTQQYIEKLQLEGAPPPSDQVLAWARDAVPVVVGPSNLAGPQHGLQLSGGWLGGPVARPQTIWVAVPASLPDQRAVTSHLAGELGHLLGEAAATAGSFKGAGGPLPEAYEMAMQVIAREWHAGAGLRGAAPPKGDGAGAELFAGVRDNRFVVRPGQGMRPAQELLADPRVAATIIYRLSQDKTLMKTVAPDAFYAPLASDRIPPGISPAAVLGAFRNLQVKLLGTWIQAARRNQAPQNIAQLVQHYAQAFPMEREEVYRTFLLFTFGGTVKPGGVSQEGPEQALNEVNNLLADVIAGKKTLTAALTPDNTEPHDKR